MSTVVDGMSHMSTIIEGLGSFKSKTTEFFQTFLCLHSSDHCFIISPPLRWYSCFHGLYYLWASHSSSLLLIFHHCSCSSRIPSILPFYFKSGFPQPITLCTAASFSFDLYAPSQCRGTFGLHEGGEALRARIPVRRWMEVTVKYSTNI